MQDVFFSLKKEEGSRTAGPSLAGPWTTEGELEIKVDSQTSHCLQNDKMHKFGHIVLTNGAQKPRNITAAAFLACLGYCAF